MSQWQGRLRGESYRPCVEDIPRKSKMRAGADRGGCSLAFGLAFRENIGSETIDCVRKGRVFFPPQRERSLHSEALGVTPSQSG